MDIAFEREEERRQTRPGITQTRVSFRKEGFLLRMWAAGFLQEFYRIDSLAWLHFVCSLMSARAGPPPPQQPRTVPGHGALLSIATQVA